MATMTQVEQARYRDLEIHPSLPGGLQGSKHLGYVLFPRHVSS